MDKFPEGADDQNLFTVAQVLQALQLREEGKLPPDEPIRAWMDGLGYSGWRGRKELPTPIPDDLADIVFSNFLCWSRLFEITEENPLKWWGPVIDVSDPVELLAKVMRALIPSLRGTGRIPYGLKGQGSSPEKRRLVVYAKHLFSIGFDPLTPNLEDPELAPGFMWWTDDCVAEFLSVFVGWGVSLNDVRNDRKKLGIKKLPRRYLFKENISKVRLDFERKNRR